MCICNVRKEIELIKFMDFEILKSGFIFKWKTHFFLFIPNILQTFQIEPFFGQNAPICNRLVAMIQVCFEKLNEYRPECVLQVDAFILIGQFVDVHVYGMNKSLH